MVLSFGEVLMDCLPDKNVIGGAPFNVVVHLSRLGVKSGIISKIGQDELGREIMSFLKTEGVDEFVQVDPNYKTGYVTVTLNNGQPSYEIHANTGWEHVGYEEPNAQPDYLVFGSLALSFPDNKASFKKYAEQFSSATKVCDINLRTPFYDKETIVFCLEQADVLKINDEELVYFEQLFACDNAISLLKNQFGITKVLLTKGSKGAELFWDGDHFEVAAGEVIDLKDTVGAGDSFTSLFLHGLIQGLPMEENLKKASSFAASICERNGAIPADKEMYNAYKI